MTTGSMHNLLTDPLIHYRESGGGITQSSLPEVYEALVDDRVESFPALRPHQRHAWHAFLVQLGAMAMQRAGLDAPPTSAGEWQRIIHSMTATDWPDDEPWHLVVDDITKPAFIQPPSTSREREQDYKSAVATPDELDMLVTSKNHDLKSSVAERAGIDDWIFALITLQTMEGYGGIRNYGVSRMPSGYGNRPAFTLTTSARPGEHFKNDLQGLQSGRSSLLDDYPMTDSGIPLLWVLPWDGSKADLKLLSDLDPYYIEICRRVRLVLMSGKMTAVRANSDAKRIAEVKGLTGDPWAPVSNNLNPRGTPLAFLGPRQFSYERVVDGLFSADWKGPLLLAPTASGKSSQEQMLLVARGMVRGEGGTKGYHERVIPMRHRILQIFGTPTGPKTLEDISRDRIGQIAVIQHALRHAVAVFASGGETTNISDEHRSWANPWANKLSTLVDASFFEDLQDELEADQPAQGSMRRAWLQKVVNDAAAILGDATNSLPCPAIHRLKAHVLAESVFWGRIRGPNGLPELFENEETEGADD